MPKPIIEVENLAKVYQLGEIGMTSLKEELERTIRRWRGLESKADEKEFWALRDIDFKVEPGEVLGIIGKNGAGKSTLLKILSRITEPSQGSITLRGRVSALLEVGTGFHQELTGRENIYLNGTILGMKKREIDAKLEEIIDFSGVEKHIDTPVKRYSSGMNVRLGFAVAAHLEPEILIVDEVLAVGDLDFQKRCLGKMKDVASAGRTVLFVSHNMASVSNLCDSGIVLESGSIIFQGTSEEAVSTYISRNLKEATDVDLTAVSSRSGNGQVQFTHASLEFPRDSKRRNYYLGEDLVLNLSLKVAESNLGRLSLAIELGTSDAIKMAHMVDRDANFQLEEVKPGTYNLRVTLRDLRLYPDQYHLGFFVGASNGRLCYDHVPEVLSFHVAAGGPMGNRPLTRNKGRLFLVPEWEVL